MASTRKRKLLTMQELNMIFTYEPNMTFTEIAKEMKVSDTRVNEIYRSAMTKLIMSQQK